MYIQCVVDDVDENYSKNWGEWNEVLIDLIQFFFLHEMENAIIYFTLSFHGIVLSFNINECDFR